MTTFRFPLGAMLLAIQVTSYADVGGFYIGGSIGYSSFNDKVDTPSVVGEPIPTGFFPVIGFPTTSGSFSTTFISSPLARSQPRKSTHSRFSTEIETETDNEDFGWKVYGGYEFSRYFRIEAGYADLGETKVETNISQPIFFFGPVPPTNLSGRNETNIESQVDIHGFQFAGIGSIPISEKISLLGKLGGYVWEAEFSTRIENDSNNFFLLPSNNVAPFINNQIVLTMEDHGVDVLFGAGVEYNLRKNIKIRAEWERYNNVRNTIGNTDIDFFSIGISYYFTKF